MFNGEPGPASAAASRNVVRSSSISGEICGSQQAGGGPGTTTAKKRRSSLGAKMVAIVGLTQWSKSTLQLPQSEGATKKLRSNIRRSTETGIAVEMRSRVTRQGSRESTDGSTNSNSSEGTFIFPTTRLGAESQFSDFLDGLGPAQIVGRQTLATPPMGDVHIAIMDRSGQLEVEVIEARGLTPKPGSKSLPATYIKVYLLENGACLAKKKTKVAKKTCDPLYQQALLFDEGPQGKVLQESPPQAPRKETERAEKQLSSHPGLGLGPGGRRRWSRSGGEFRASLWPLREMFPHLSHSVPLEFHRTRVLEEDTMPK
uniref:Regulating synaptic membrane exocytosis 3 n=2 Tax=Canis lupus familiaris TaxID=9615 RepID=A0A8C0SDE9_CANLF